MSSSKMMTKREVIDLDDASETVSENALFASESPPDEEADCPDADLDEDWEIESEGCAEDDEITLLKDSTDSEAQTGSHANTHATFKRNGNIIMTLIYEGKVTRIGGEWREELDKQSSEQWFADLAEFVPAAVKQAFGNSARPPTIDELLVLPFFGDHKGGYVDVLHCKTGSKSRIYNGCVTHRRAELRKWDHDREASFRLVPTSKYYQLKHGTKDYDSKFFSFARIPISLSMSKPAIIHRRLLCRLAEVVSVIWMDAFDKALTDKHGLREASKTVFEKMYPPSQRQVQWDGLTTHSPLLEHTGVADYGTKAKQLYEEIIEGYIEVYGSVEEVPDDIKLMVEKRAGKNLRTRRTPTAEEKVQNNEANKRKRDAWDEERREQDAQYQREWHQNRKEQMTEQDKVDLAGKAREATVRQRYRDGKYTQKQFDAMAANDWYKPRTSNQFSVSPQQKEISNRRSRKYDMDMALQYGIITQAQYAAAEAKDYRTPDGFPYGWNTQMRAKKKAAKEKPAVPRSAPKQALAPLRQAPAPIKTKQTSIMDMFGKK